MYCYLFLINAIALLFMYLDKQFAKHRTWRIPEVVLLAIAVLYGSLGIWIGMYLFHHKTRKPLFYLSVPLILAVQIFLFLRFVV